MPFKTDVSHSRILRTARCAAFFQAGAYCLTALNGFNGLLLDYKSEKRNAGLPDAPGERIRLPRKWRNKGRIIERGPHVRHEVLPLSTLRLSRSSPFPFDPPTDTEANDLILTWMLTRLPIARYTVSRRTRRGFYGTNYPRDYVDSWKGVERRDATHRRQPVRDRPLQFSASPVRLLSIPPV